MSTWVIFVLIDNILIWTQIYITQEISFADYLWISAIASLEKGSEKFTQLGFNFKGGRVDCPTSPLTEDIYPFPDPSMQREEMMEFFADPVNGFGFTENEVRLII